MLRAIFLLTPNVDGEDVNIDGEVDNNTAADDDADNDVDTKAAATEDGDEDEDDIDEAETADFDAAGGDNDDDDNDGATSDDASSNDTAAGFDDKDDDNDGVKEDADVSAGTVATNDEHDDDNDGNGDGILYGKEMTMDATKLERGAEILPEIFDEGAPMSLENQGSILPIGWALNEEDELEKNEQMTEKAIEEMFEDVTKH
ncbi:Replicase polyprotein 1ab [Stylophora pistillata]|uniref:Replicase polyprotein 1ab n=1 Tax=Stylophora pistillata TaxID=50429 RepID=A0A2B4RPZ0_STYPI|nr:Replicase polyprotein 1ab [Stylophora pistillata]